MKILTSLPETQYPLCIPKECEVLCGIEKTILDSDVYLNGIPRSKIEMPFIFVSRDEPQSNSYQIQNCHSTMIVKASLQKNQADAQYQILKKKDLITGNFETKPLALCTADCLPIVLYYENEDHVMGAVVHAGWRGFCAGILQNSLDVLIQEAQQLNIGQSCFLNSLQVLIGPAIFGTSYECGLDVKSALLAHKNTLNPSNELVQKLYPVLMDVGAIPAFAGMTDHPGMTTNALSSSRKRGSSPLSSSRMRGSKIDTSFPDLQLLAAIDCQAHGLPNKNIAIWRENTYTHPHLYSYRRAQKQALTQEQCRNRQWIHLYFQAPCTRNSP